MAHNGSPGQKLTPRQRRSIVALLSERDVSHAAIAAKVGRRTLVRWLAEPAFQAELSRAEGEAIAAATRRLVRYQDSAIDKLGDLVAVGSSETLQLRAAQSVLDFLIKLRDLRNTEERLSALENAVFNKPGGFTTGD